MPNLDKARALSPAMIDGLEILKDRGVLVWETDNPTVVNKRTLDALVDRGLATRETSGSHVSGHQSIRRFGHTWIKGYYHRSVKYRAA